ncbi:MAG: hypothetical protein FJ164_12735 [Gammaproteobacteria bacterium]|nr:hypothetical protein [Gammaproteobacteria bacterium]
MKLLKMSAGLMLGFSSLTAATEGMTSVGLTSNDVGTLHMQGEMGKGVKTEFLLDTGSAYVVLSDSTRRELEAQSALVKVRHLRAVMANNATVRAAVYRVNELKLSAGCVIRNFEAVAIPGAEKDILGLSALKTVAPFTVSLDPSVMEMTCADEAAKAKTAAVTEAPRRG